MGTQGLLFELKAWREKQAGREGVELYRVMPNAALEEIARTKPATKDALMSIKGIKEAKFRKYGREILEIVASFPVTGTIKLENSGRRGARSKEQGASEDGDGADLGNQQSEIENLQSEALSVSRFLDGVNLELSGMAARVKGEVSSVDERERVVYFSIKDAEDGSSLPCLIFRSAYVMSGIRLSVGDEVIVEGVPEIWKPMGKLSFKCGFIEYAGEGALKKAYDALLAKLTTEGLLAPERKREIPAFPHRIALLTSRDGAAIGDFMMNVGRHGYRIDLYASSVEGARAVPELLAGVRHFQKHADSYDLLVVIRGGGSLESLAAFNNETLVREIASFPIPVIAGIGHEKDVTLSALVADAMVSTPTAASRLVRQSWEEGAERVLRAEHAIAGAFSASLNEAAVSLEYVESTLADLFREMKERIRTLIDRFVAKREWVRAGIRVGVESVSTLENGLKKGKNQVFLGLSERLSGLEKLLAQFDPSRALRLGYSLVRLSSGKLLRSSTDATVGDRLDIRLSEGRIGAEVIKIAD